MNSFNGKYSGRDFQSYCNKLSLKSFKDYDKILDIGGGFSTFTYTLSQKGKNAFALDIGYKDIDEMIKKYFSQSITKQLSEKYPCDGIARMEINKIRKKHVVNFLNSKKQIYQNYISGNCFNLPFKENTFDLVVNVESLGNKHYFSYCQFLQGVEKILKVTRETRIYSKYLHNLDKKSKEGLLNRGLKIESEKRLLIIKHSF